MSQMLQVLIVEDNPDDAELIVRELRQADFNLEWLRVETEPDFLGALQKQPDIILSDYSMPRFSGLRALELLQASGLDIPLILISGTVGEDVAVEAMRYGAKDYLLKDRIARLPSAVERALKEKLFQLERKQVETALRQSEERKAAILAGALDAVITMNHEGIVVDWNPTAEKIFGCRREDVVGRMMSEVIIPDGMRESYQQAVKEMVSTGENHAMRKPMEISALRADGTEFPVELFITCIQKEPPLFTGFLRDITERRKLEDQLRQSQKMDAIGQLAGGVAHDFNNILAVIQMQAGLLQAEQGLLPTHLEYAREIEASAQRAANLTRQLLLFSRRQVMRLGDFDLNENVSSITKMLQRILGEDIRMQLKFAAKPLFVHADPGMIDQVLMNLAVNSRDAMPKGGLLIIETSFVEFDESAVAQAPRARAGSFACLSVSDTGLGISKETMPRIFEPFFTTKEVGKGTGLGLATVFGIVQQHQGWINVYSEAGQGTTFRIYLPRLAGFVEKSPIGSTLAHVRGGKETILVVEDDPSLRASVCIALRRLGYRVIEAVDGGEALKIWSQQRSEIHLLLTDLVMPGGMTGKELGERILKDNPKLKVIYSSGYSLELADKDFLLQSGVNFLTKPFQIAELGRAIRTQLDS